MAMADRIFVGGGGAGYAQPQELLLAMGNRHGLIAGATGTGKTVTLQILAEGFAAEGVPVFLTDIKGDLSGLATAGDPAAKNHASFMERAGTIGFDLRYQAFSTCFWDIFGEQGHPVRTTVAEMGPLLLSRLMNLTDVQEGVLNIAFRAADDEGLALLDLEDLQALLIWCGQNQKDLSLRYGNVTTASVGAIQRALLTLENQGGALLFGEPALDLADLMRTDTEGRGIINILASDRLMNAPRLYATFLLWLLSELFEQLPEVGNPDKPKLVFFFDEAHLLFDDAPKILVDKIEQVARLIRSKGVGVYFVTQNPADVPDSVLSQLGNRIQHALRAFTAKDRRDLQKAAETYRDNPAFKTDDAIMEVGTGEAVTSLLDRKGVPLMVERTLIRPPMSQVGPIPAAMRQNLMAASPMAAKYATRINRESAYEILAKRATEAAQPEEAADAPSEYNRGRRYDPKAKADPAPAPKPRAGTGKSISAGGLGEALGSALVKELGGTTGRRIVRGIFGTMFRGR